MPETFFLMELVEENAFTTKRPHRNSVIVVVQSAHVKLQKRQDLQGEQIFNYFHCFLMLIPKHGLVSTKVYPLSPPFLVGYWDKISSP